MSSPTEQPNSQWKAWLNSMTPERLAQQRGYERERGKKYNQDHKEERTKKRQDHYRQNKNHYCEKHVCEICGGQYTISHKNQHLKTKRHQATLHTQLRPEI